MKQKTKAEWLGTKNTYGAFTRSSFLLRIGSAIWMLEILAVELLNSQKCCAVECC